MFVFTMVCLPDYRRWHFNLVDWPVNNNDVSIETNKNETNSTKRHNIQSYDISVKSAKEKLHLFIGTVFTSQ